MTVLAAVNPPAVAAALWPRERRAPMAVAAAIAGLLAVIVAALSDPVLDALDVSPATFRVAAGIVLGLAAARWLIVGAPAVSSDGSPDGWGRVGVPLLIPVLVTPQLVTVSLSAGADDGVAVVVAGAAVGLLLASVGAIVPKRRQVVWTTGARLVAALAIALALALAVDGVKTV